MKLTKPNYTKAIMVLEQDLDESLQRANLGKDIDMWRERAQSLQEAIEVLRSMQNYIEKGTWENSV